MTPETRAARIAEAFFDTACTREDLISIADRELREAIRATRQQYKQQGLDACTVCGKGRYPIYYVTRKCLKCVSSKGVENEKTIEG